MSEETPNKEDRILSVMRSILIDVIKDTTTEPGLKHPLTDNTINNIRHGLDLITARQRELAEEQGESWDLRPSYPPEPQQQTKDGVVVQLSSVKKKKTDKKKTEPDEND